MQGSHLPIINAETLACRRGDRLLFSGLDLAVAPREAVHVTGANGAGKTTLIRTLAGLAEPFAGTVRISGRSGLLDHRAALDPEAPLGQALGFWFGLDGVAGGSQIVERLRLAALMEVPVRFLSTGQTKRAAFARLVGQRADAWLLDEPLAGLDAASQSLVNDLIAEHCANGGAALIASHHPLAIHGLREIAIGDFAHPEEFAQ